MDSNQIRIEGTLEAHVMLVWRMTSRDEPIAFADFLESHGMRLQWSWKHDANYISIHNTQRFMLFAIKHPPPDTLHWKDIQIGRAHV